MGLWAKSLRIFNAFCDNAKQSIRQVAHQTGFSKSSVHRLTQAMKGRDKHPESWWWETEAGRCWLIRLVVATLYTFGPIVSGTNFAQHRERSGYAIDLCRNVHILMIRRPAWLLPPPPR